MEVLTVPGLDQMRQALEEIEEYVGKYSLADAIREGSQYTSQMVGDWFDAADNRVCALTAAFLAVAARI